VERIDATIEAQKALSAMHRTGGRFGATHIADILVGANTEKIRERQHNLLPTYGVGKEHDKVFWRSLIDALLAQGLAGVDDPQYPTPKVTEEGWKILRKQRDFQMIRSAPSKKSKTKSPSGGSVERYSEGLFEQLRTIRMELAMKGNVPPYVVFSDRSLHEMAAYFPTTPEQLLLINGVGNHKLDTYGKPFLEAISDYAVVHPDEYAGRLLFSQAEEREYEAPKPMNSERETLRLLVEGKTLEEIGMIRLLKQSTIIGHLETLLNAGVEVPFTPEIAPDRLEQIAEWFRQANSWNLGPVVELAAGQLDYEEAKLARIALKQQKT
jgi:ATP-dependent DNA helicase RecQ